MTLETVFFLLCNSPASEFYVPTWIFSTAFIKIFKCKNFMGAELFHVDRRTNTTKLKFAYRKFANAPKNQPKGPTKQSIMCTRNKQSITNWTMEHVYKITMNRYLKLKGQLTQSAAGGKFSSSCCWLGNWIVTSEFDLTPPLFSWSLWENLRTFRTPTWTTYTQLRFSAHGVNCVVVLHF